MSRRNMRLVSEIESMAAECYRLCTTVETMIEGRRMLAHWRLVEPPTVVALLHRRMMQLWAVDVVSDKRLCHLLVSEGFTVASAKKLKAEAEARRRQTN